MVFLNPAVLLGLLASSIPILVHLLNLRKLKRVEFSTLAFLKELQKTKVKRIKIKQWLLLALRILIIIFLVASFARPTLESSTLGVSSAAKTTGVFVIDNSFSMSVVQENGSKLNRSKSIAANIIGQYGEGDDIHIINAATPADAVSTSNEKNAAGIVDGIELSNRKDNLKGALAKASAIAGGSKNFNKEIYVFSDFQKFPEGKEDTTGFNKNEDTRVYYFDFSGDPARNISIDSLKTNSRIFEKNKPVSFTAWFTNHDTRTASRVVASLFINGRKSGVTNLELEPGVSKSADFKTTIKETGILTVKVALEPDAIEQDNERFTALFLPEQISVLAVYENSEDITYLKAAISGDTSGQPVDLEVTRVNYLSSFDLRNYDVIILAGEPGTGGDALGGYVTSGGNLVVFPGNKSTRTSFNGFLADAGLPASPQLAEPGAESPAEFGNIDFRHPLFTGLFRENAEPSVSSPEIYKYFRIDPAGTGRTIIGTIDGSAFLSEYEKGNGKILLFASAPSADWSSFALKGLFAPLLNKSVYYLSSSDIRERRIITGETVAVNTGGITGSRLEVRRPDNTRDFIVPDSGSSNNFLSYSNTELPGVYKFYSDNKLVDYFAVNTDPEESAQEFMDEESIEKILAKINTDGITQLDPEPGFLEKINQARFGTELWRYFLIAALLLAIAEMTVARNTRKEMANL